MHYCVSPDDVCFYFESIMGETSTRSAWPVGEMTGLLYLSDRIASGRIVEVFDPEPMVIEKFDQSIAKWRRRYGAQA